MSTYDRLLQLADKHRSASAIGETRHDAGQVEHRVLADTPVAEPAVPTLSDAPGWERAWPTLPVDDLTRQELSKIVQQLVSLPDSCRTLAFSANKSGNGCSWLISRLSEALAAQYPGSVCLVDANLHSPSLHDYFGIENLNNAMPDAMASPAVLERFTRHVQGNLWLVTCGSLYPEGEVQPGSEVLRARLGDLRANFDWVLIDAPPLSSGGDAVAVARLADGLVMVLEANVTNREAARKATEDLAAANVHVVGAVLNKRTFPIPGRLYKHL